MFDFFRKSSKNQIVQNKLDSKLENFTRLNSYADQSTVCLIPTRGSIDARVVNSWFKLISPVNHKFVRLFFSGGEVGDAYNTAIMGVLHHPQLSRFKYILTLEDDNLPPEDGLLKLLESLVGAEKRDENLWAVAGLYWSKGAGNTAPIAFGDVRKKEWNLDFIDFAQTGVTNCYLIPQGFTLYKMDLFRKLNYPWFKTVQEFNPSNGVLDQISRHTQDYHFFRRCYEEGIGVGVRADVQVGHLDVESGVIW